MMIGSGSHAPLEIDYLCHLLVRLRIVKIYKLSPMLLVSYFIFSRYYRHGEISESLLRMTHRPRLGRLCGLVSSKIVRVVCKIQTNINFVPILSVLCVKTSTLISMLIMVITTMVILPFAWQKKRHFPNLTKWDWWIFINCHSLKEFDHFQLNFLA